jgi:hypothetical protein
MTTTTTPSPLDGLNMARERAQRLVDQRTEEATNAINLLKEAVDALDAYDRAITAVIACENKIANPKPPKPPKLPKHSPRRVGNEPLTPLGTALYGVLPEDGSPMAVSEIAKRLKIGPARAGVSASHLARHNPSLVERVSRHTYRRIVAPEVAP